MKTVPSPRLILSILALLSLTACTQSTVTGESRLIDVLPEGGVAAEPAGSAGISQLVSRAGPTYVTLNISHVEGASNKPSERSKKALTSGSGFVVDGTGYIMTAAHVAVEKNNVVAARAADGRIYSGRVVDVRPANDMALIKLTGFSGRAVVPSTNTCVKKGAELFSLGKPHEQRDVARVGTLDAMRFGRPVQYGKFGYPDAMVVHMSTQRGESGGPLFNAKGELQGMIVSTLSDGNGTPLKLAHALPVSDLAGFLCGEMSCSARWKALSGQSAAACGN